MICFMEKNNNIACKNLNKNLSMNLNIFTYY